MSTHENGGGERKTSSFSRNGNGSAQVTLPVSLLVALAPTLLALGIGGGVAAHRGVEAPESVTEALGKVDRKLDVIIVRLDQFEPRLVIVEAEARRNSDRLTRLEERDAASRPQAPR